MATLYRIYMDDSGNVDPQTTNDPAVRYGSITAVILTADYLDAKFNSGFHAIVEKHFGLDANGLPHNIHRRILATVPPAKGPFAVLADAGKRAAWDADAMMMFQKAQYTVISACVDKVEWYWRFPNWRGDFYEVLVEAVLERCYYFLRHRGRAEVNIEWKNAAKNERVKVAYRKALDFGFRFISAQQLNEVFTSRELNILTKDDRRPGCQLADLLAGPAMQHLRMLHGMRDQIDGSFVRQVVDLLEREKFYREGTRGPAGYGRLWRPAPQT